MRLEEVVAELKRFFDDQDDVDVAYLFGSAARGRRLPDSDVDVGILFANGFGGDGSARGAAGGVGSPSGPFALRPEGPQGVEGD